jgi:hypothetical protein
VAKLEDAAQYIGVARVYIEYVIKYFSVRSPSPIPPRWFLSSLERIFLSLSLQDKEINVLLRDLVRHMHPNRAYSQLQDDLEQLGQHLIRSVADYPRLVAMDQFLPFLDLFVGRAKVSVAKALLECFAK